MRRFITSYPSAKDLLRYEQKLAFACELLEKPYDIQRNVWHEHTEDGAVYHLEYYVIYNERVTAQEDHEFVDALQSILPPGYTVNGFDYGAFDLIWIFVNIDWDLAA